jgi:glutamate synthase domain-containing protein 3
VRELNQRLHDLEEPGTTWRIENPRGAHAIACGMKVAAEIQIDGHAGYYCAGMNQLANITVHGNVGVGAAENMMSGLVRVKGQASQSAGATAHGGLLVIEGDAAARCGISLKGGNIVVGGSVGHMTGFLSQLGNIVVCGDAGEALGDSLYETRIYVRGNVAGLGADCIEKEMRPEHSEALAKLLEDAGMNVDAGAFRRYGSARELYSFKIDDAEIAAP